MCPTREIFSTAPCIKKHCCPSAVNFYKGQEMVQRNKLGLNMSSLSINLRMTSFVNLHLLYEMFCIGRFSEPMLVYLKTFCSGLIDSLTNAVRTSMNISLAISYQIDALVCRRCNL